MSIFLIFLGIVIVLLGLKSDLGSCRDEGDRIRLGWFLIGLAVSSIVMFLANQWLPSAFAWAIWVAFFISIVLLVRWIQRSRPGDEPQADT